MSSGVSSSASPSATKWRSKKMAPSILSADFANLQSEIQKVAAAGADWLHVDVMDGHFVPNLTIGPAVVESLKKVSPLPLDVHLMIENPEKYVEAFAKAGADYLTLHIETLAQDQVFSVIQKIRSLGVKPGLTLRPRTDLSRLEPFLSEIDLLLVMTVEPGFSGQSFMQDQKAKIHRARQLIDQIKPSILLEVDGGVNLKTIKECAEADVIVAGHAVFRAPDYAQAIADLKRDWSDS